MSASGESKVPNYLRYVEKLPASKPDKYKLLKKIQCGGFGKIYEAALNDDREGPRFAIKMKLGNFDITNTERMEVHALKTLDREENVVKMLDLIRGPKDLMIVMTLAKTDLSRLLGAENLPISSGEKRTILYQLFQGLSAIHRNKIIHRDIKPGNVLISFEGIIQITDFGMSVPLVIGDKRSPLGGTLYYKPLELLMEDDEFNEKVDVWASGCSMAELWMKKHLFYPELKTVMHQIEAISEYCSFPTEKEWPRVVTFKYYSQIEYLNRRYKRNRLQWCAREITQGDNLAAELLVELLHLNPEDRISSNEILNHGYFTQAPVEPNLKSLLERMG